MTIQFLGHACFMISHEAHRILVDPFFTGNPSAAAKAEEMDCTMILVTHGHDDHLGDAVEIARRLSVPVLCIVDVGAALPEDVQTICGNIGGWVPTEFGKVKITTAIHGSGIPGALSCGFIIEIGGKRIYHAGDTALTMDMQLLADENIDLALLPIGDHFTMGPKDAIRAVKMISPKCVIPMHFNTFPPIRQDGNAFCESVRKETESDAILLAPGETTEL